MTDHDGLHGAMEMAGALKPLGVRHITGAEVSLDEGSGIVHIAPGCGSEDFELSKLHDLAVLAPVDEAGRFIYASYGVVVVRRRRPK